MSNPPCICGHDEDEHDEETGVCLECHSCNAYLPDPKAEREETGAVFD